MGSVVFDCDSTLSGIEGIEFVSTGQREAVEALTRQAMDGSLPLENVYGQRLELVRPGRSDLERLTTAYIESLTKDAREVVATLLSEGVVVRVISGGLLPAVRGLAVDLGLGEGDVAAVDVSFDARGEWAGFDAASPLARSGGKSEILAAWRTELPPPVMMVGDGATDAEARDAVDLFVAYCGVVERPAVAAVADHVIRTASLAPVLALALDRPPADAGQRALYEKGRSLLSSGATEPRPPEPGKQRV